MNVIAEEIKSYIGSAQMSDEEFLEHYGMPRRSGRYPWGSGEDPYQHEPDFLSRVEQLKAKGWQETPENIRKEFGLTTSQYRIEKSICNDERKALDIARAKSLKADGLSTSEIGRRMGVNESTVRGWFAQEQKARYNQSKATADFLKKQVDQKKMIDVGKNTEFDLNVSREKLDTALYLLEREGYHVYGGRVPQPTNKDQMTTLKVLAAPDVDHKEIFNYDKIQTINDYITRDGGETYEKKYHYPASLDSKRVKVILKDEIGPDGFRGDDLDGVIQIRRGVKDLDLGNSRYAQVRILVDNDKYLKGMAVYSDNIPDGYDVVFNSNKKTREDAFKSIKDDPDNPFGAAIKPNTEGGQYWYDPKTGQRVSANTKGAKLGLINKTREEGDWSEWKDSLPSQFLAKQSKSLAQKQLNLAKANKEAEYDEIMSLENPTIKKYYLKKFADSCDSAATDLKAAALPGQKTHVILPINTLKETEVYAPQYKDGIKVALVRYPHGGTFEIPILTVNNKDKAAAKIIGKDSIDAVGINKKVADRLSGADYDGDFVVVIPTHDPKGKVKITSTPELPGLKGFDTKSYKYDEVRTDKNGKEHYYRNGKEFKIMKNTNTQMGIVSNLITDMTIQGASNDELARAVRHSMVVIDAEKHKLDYRQSYIENNISQLQRKYQPKFDKDGNVIRGGGASTIFSRAKGVTEVEKRRGQAKINIKGKPWYNPSKPEGSLLYTKADDKDLYYALDKYDKKSGIRTLYTTDGKQIKYDTTSKEDYKKYAPVMRKDKKTGEVYFTNGDGSIKYKTKARTQYVTNMSNTDDAMTLLSSYRHPKEIVYAEYANSMKALANKARKSYMEVGKLEYNPTAKKIYAKEVSELEAALNTALKNSVKERTATRLAASEINARKKSQPDLKTDDIRKLSQRSMSKYREQVGAATRRERNIVITDKQWEAIQAGAISDNKLKQILANSDPDSLRQKAMPRKTSGLTKAQVARIRAMNNSNFTINQIAEKMNISPSAVSKYLKGVD
jgi:DNA-binding CsgD family transcriptional regulator